MRESPEPIQQTLAQASEGMRRFLLTSAVPMRFTLYLCEHILRIPDAATHLQDSPLPQQEGNEYTYEPEVRDALRQQFKRENPLLYVNLNLRLVQWARGNHQQVDEVLYLAEATRTEEAVNLAETIVQPLAANGKNSTVMEIYAALQDSDLPMPQMHYSVALVMQQQARFADALDHLNSAKAQLVEAGAANLLDRIRFQEAFVYQKLGEYEQALKIATAVLHRDPDTVTLGNTLQVAGVAHFHLGNIDEAIRFLQRALKISEEEIGDLTMTNRILQDLVLTVSHTNDHDNLHEVATKFTQTAKALGNPIQLAWALNSVGVIYRDEGEYDRALESFKEGLATLGEEHINVRCKAYLSWNLGTVYRDVWMYDDAERYFVQALQEMGDLDPYFRCRVLIKHSTLARWRGDREKAIQLAEDALEIARTHKMHREELLACMYLQAARGEDPDFDEIEMDDPDFLPGLAISASFADDPTDAQDILLRGEDAETHTHQAFAAEIAHQGLDRTIADAPDTFVHTQEQIKKLEPYMPTSDAPKAQAGNVTTYRVDLKTLGEITALRDGEEVRKKEYDYVKEALELVLYLVFHGARTKDQIAVDLFPEHNKKRVRKELQRAKYAACKALPEIIVYEHGVYAINHKRVHLTCDAMSFMERIEEAKRYALTHTAKEVKLRQAEDQYNGAFLKFALIDSEWTNLLRRQLESAYVDCLRDLGRCAEKRGDLEAAAGWLNQASQKDPLREDLYCLLMTVYGRANRLDLVEQTWQDLCQVMETELQKSPSAKAHNLYKKLTQ